MRVPSAEMPVPNGRQNGRVTRGNPPFAAIRWLLLLRLPPSGVRIVDVVVLFLGIPVAIVVCIPILAVTAIASIPIGSLLSALNAPAVVGAVFALVWFGGGLALCFVALLRIYRRLPAAMRAWVTPEDTDEEPPAQPFDRDPDANAGTLTDRIAEVDATFAPRGPDPDGNDRAD
jgi:hypothetical protein